MISKKLWGEVTGLGEPEILKLYGYELKKFSCNYWEFI